MAYIGNKLADAYTSFAKQDFTTSATTSYTLDYPVTNENEIALFINFVRQEPTTAYSASGTSLTLTSATSSSDDMYCVFLGKALQTVNPPAGSVGASQLASSLDLSSKTITLASNMKNTPAFQVYVSSDQSLSASTNTKADFDTEIFDTDSAFDISTQTFTVPSGKSGKYVYHIQCGISNGTDAQSFVASLYKNGAALTTPYIGYSFLRRSGTNSHNFVHSGIITLADADTLYVNVYTADSSINLRANESFFTIYKLVE